MGFVVFDLAAFLAGAFVYLFFSKIRSRHTIALHRHPTEIRRKWREEAFASDGIDSFYVIKILPDQKSWGVTEE